MEISPPPFTILALAPLAELPDQSPPFQVLEVTRDSLDAAVEALSPTLAVPVPTSDCPQGVITFKATGMRDFTPHRLAVRVPYLAALTDAGKIVETGLAQGTAAEAIAARVREAAPGIPLELSSAPAAAADAHAHAVDDLLAMVSLPGTAGPSATAGDVRGWQRQIDDLRSRLMTCIFNDGGFRRLEAAWRGVAALVRRAGNGVCIQIASIAPARLESVLNRVVERFSETPPGLILLDVEMDGTARGISQLAAALACADALMSPTAVWIGPGFFHIDGWRALGKLPYLKHHLDDAAYAKWRRHRTAPGSEWLAVTTNRFLLRPPYGAADPAGPVPVEEAAPLWISPVWALGILAAGSIAAWGWASRFTDARSVRLADLAVYPVDDERSAATEALLAEDRITEFTDIGVIPLVGGVNRDTAAMPREATFAGGSLKFQYFFNRLLGFLFALKAATETAGEAANGADDVAQALAAFFRATGQTPPADLTVSLATAEDGQPPALAIGLTPPAAVLPHPERIEFTLAWP